MCYVHVRLRCEQTRGRSGRMRTPSMIHKRGQRQEICLLVTYSCVCVCTCYVYACTTVPCMYIVYMYRVHVHNYGDIELLGRTQWHNGVYSYEDTVVLLQMCTYCVEGPQSRPFSTWYCRKQSELLWPVWQNTTHGTLVGLWTYQGGAWNSLLFFMLVTFM